MTGTGFVDLQVNGYLGVDFSSTTLQLDDIHRVTHALVGVGTIGYCATIISSQPEVYQRNLPLLARAMEEDGVKGRLLGIHLEGPYLSDTDGARGAHLAAVLRPPSMEEFKRFQEWSRGHIAVLTLAPELEGAIDFIERVRAYFPTQIALGHHMATREVVKQAVEAGAALSTHLGNGCPATLPRHDNVIIAQLAEDRLLAGLITDGNHLPDDFIRVVFKCKEPHGVIVVSDSAPIAGLEPGYYETLGNQVRMAETGRIENLNSCYLVGSGCNMAQCMRHLASLGFLTPADLRRVGYVNPLSLLGIPIEADE